MEGVYNVRATVHDHFAYHFKDEFPFKHLDVVAKGGDLIRSLCEDEVKQVVCNCNDIKSVGPDGVNFGFIKDFLGLMKNDFTRFVF